MGGPLRPFATTAWIYTGAAGKRKTVRGLATHVSRPLLLDEEHELKIDAEARY